MTIEELNALPLAEARAEIERCCGASRWVDDLCAHRPFADRAALFAEAERIWRKLDHEDWREAFGHHPKIGDVESLRRRFATTAGWAADEQRGAAEASERTFSALARGNRAYEEKFGYIFIVCATGKSAEEMLGLLEARIHNDPEVEIQIAAEEQMKITRLRLEKLLGGTS